MSNVERDDKIALEGVVIESNKGIFKVMISENHIINCKLGGKLRINDIKIIPGDLVIAECSPYDMSVGRVVKRLKSS